MKNTERAALRRGKMNNAFDPSNINNLDVRTQELLKRRVKVLGPAYRLFYKNPVEFCRAEGVYMYDKQGNEYLDAYNNVVSVGHCRPEINKAINHQMEVLCTHTRYLQNGILDFAEKLVATFEKEIEHVMFTCTGSEANDLAVRIAKHHTKNQGIIITSEAYHGNSELTSSFSPSMGENCPLGKWVRRIPAPDTYRLQNKNLGLWMAQKVSEQIEDLQKCGQGIAALLVDSLFTSDGIFAHSSDILGPVVQVVREAGGVFIADEVQSGLSRSGSNMWGYQRHNVIPDLVTMGKPLGNGYPVAAVAMRPNVVADFGHEMRYFNTFGGNSVAIAAANATLEVLQKENLGQNAEIVGQILLSGLHEIAKADERIGDIRGTGLYIGVEIVKHKKNKSPDRNLALALVNEMRNRRVLISATAFNGNVLKVRPPLIFKPKDADRFLTQLRASLKNL